MEENKAEEKIFTLRFIGTLVITVLVTVAVVIGVFFLWDTLYVKPFVTEFEEVPHIVLSDDVTINGEDILLTEEDLLERNSRYTAYRSSVLYDSLSDNGKLVYRAMEYAMEESLPFICVDRRLVAGGKELEDILRCLSLDSPLLEQNLRYASQEFSVNYPLSVWNFRPIRATFEGYYIKVSNFEDNLWDKKQEALDAAEALVDALPDGMSAEEASEVLFRRIALGAEYFDYPRGGNHVESYLHDALLKGKANCDGYTNALALVYRLAGIECVEKTYNGDTEKGESGHTWLSFRLDGKWYNADATGRATIPETVTAMKGGLYYGYADILQGYVPLFAERYPPCEDGLAIKVDAHVATTDDPSLTQIFISGLRKNDTLWTLVVTDSMTKKQVQAHVQATANVLKCNITTRYVELAEGRTAIFLYTAF